MKPDLIVSIDLGTTRLKVSAFDERGRLIHLVSRRNVEQSRGADSDAETARSWQSADAWWKDTCEALVELLRHGDIDATRVRAVSLSGRAGAGVFVDGQGQVIADPWSDNRHRGELAGLVAGLERNSAFYGPTLLAKWQWLEKHEADVAAAVRHAMYGKDFIGFRLTGEVVTDPSSGPDGPWPRELLERAGIDAARLPAVGMPWEIAGTVTAGAARETGLVEGTPVAVGAHDGISANAGAGALGAREFALTLGTHAVIRSIEKVWPEGSRRFYGYPPDRHVIGGNALFAGRSLDWFIDTTAPTVESRRRVAFERFDEAASGVTPGAGGVVFLPFPGGRIAPDREPGIRAAFAGVGLETDHAALYRAVLEGTAFALADVMDQLSGWVGLPKSVGVTGSGARSPVWTQIIADVLGTPLSLTDDASEGRGAAIFAAAALGLYPSVRDAAANMIEITRRVEPDPTRHERYRDLRERWQIVAVALRDLDGSR